MDQNFKTDGGKQHEHWTGLYGTKTAYDDGSCKVSTSTDSANAKGNYGPLKYIKSTADCKYYNFRFVIPKGRFTICSVSRYTGTSKQDRILRGMRESANDREFYHGHGNGVTGKGKPGVGFYYGPTESNTRGNLQKNNCVNTNNCLDAVGGDATIAPGTLTPAVPFQPYGEDTLRIWVPNKKT